MRQENPKGNGKRNEGQQKTPKLRFGGLTHVDPGGGTQEPHRQSGQEPAEQYQLQIVSETDGQPAKDAGEAGGHVDGLSAYHLHQIAPQYAT